MMFTQKSNPAGDDIATTTGKAFGGGFLTRGQIYKMLHCPTYIGEVHHKGQVYPGLHTGIIDRDIWDRTQQLLSDNLLM